MPEWRLPLLPLLNPEDLVGRGPIVLLLVPVLLVPV